MSNWNCFFYIILKYYWTSVISSQIKISNFTTPHPTYECLTALRCLYKKSHQPEVWQKLMQLEAHVEEFKRSPKYETDRRNVVQFLMNFFKLGDEFSEEEILKVCGIIQVEKISQKALIEANLHCSGRLRKFHRELSQKPALLYLFHQYTLSDEVICGT